MDKAMEAVASAKDKMEETLMYFEENLKNYRAGKANTSVFNQVMVSYYGAMTPLPQMSSITTPDAKTIIIQPWDKGQLKAIEKAIIDANLGYTPSNNGETIRINVPALTEERRRELVKKAHTDGESSKVSIRNARRDAIEALKKMVKDGLPEDSEKDFEDQVQKATDAAAKKVEDLLAAKEKEIMTV